MLIILFVIVTFTVRSIDKNGIWNSCISVLYICIHCSTRCGKTGKDRKQFIVHSKNNYGMVWLTEITETVSGGDKRAESWSFNYNFVCFSNSDRIIDNSREKYVDQIKIFSNSISQWQVVGYLRIPLFSMFVLHSMYRRKRWVKYPSRTEYI